MAASPEPFGPSSSSPPPRFSSSLGFFWPSRAPTSSDAPPGSGSAPRCRLLGPGARGPVLHHRPFWAPSTKNRWWARPPRSLRSLFGSFRGRKKKKAGGRGRAGKQSRFFLLRAGIFFIFFLRLVGVQVYFLVVNIILSSLGGFGCLQVTLSLQK